MTPLTEGKYVIKFTTRAKDSNKSSLMGSYLAQRAIITKTAEFMTITLHILDNEIVLGFQLEGSSDWDEAVEYRVDDVTNQRFELFDLNELTETINARIQYEYPEEGKILKTDEEFRIEFDHESIESV